LFSHCFSFTLEGSLVAASNLKEKVKCLSD
jgi:hypothetical protein